MSSKNTIDINTLDEYIKYIEGRTNYIYRGENDKFQMILASAFRRDSTDYTWRIKEFLDIVGNDLTNTQKDNFLAFSQHHGIPTCLVDFTYSPLVALFFACYGATYDKSTSGYVYMINVTSSKDIILNITSANS